MLDEVYKAHCRPRWKLERSFMEKKLCFNSGHFVFTTILRNENIQINKQLKFPKSWNLFISLHLFWNGFPFPKPLYKDIWLNIFRLFNSFCKDFPHCRRKFVCEVGFVICKIHFTNSISTCILIQLKNSPKTH